MAVTLTNVAGMNYVAGTVTATDDAISLNRFTTLGGVAFAISGTWSGTITFEATANKGLTWVAFNITPSNSGTDVSTTTANGAWSKQNNGYSGFRARFSTASSGTPVISITSLPSQF